MFGASEKTPPVDEYTYVDPEKITYYLIQRNRNLTRSDIEAVESSDQPVNRQVPSCRLDKSQRTRIHADFLSLNPCHVLRIQPSDSVLILHMSAVGNFLNFDSSLRLILKCFVLTNWEPS